MQDNPSYWEKDTFLAPFDVLVIGGGIVGCAAALHCAYQEPKLRVAVVERGTIPRGASTRNAGFACFGSISEIINDIETMGAPGALEIITSRKSGLSTLFELIRPDAMDYTHTGGYEVFRAEDVERYHRCQEWMDVLNANLQDVFGGPSFVPDDTVAERMGLTDIAHAIAHPYEGHLHPGKMMQAFWQAVQQAGVSRLSGIPIARMEPEERYVHVRSDDGLALRARFVIVATNAFAGDLLSGLDIQPARNQVYLTSPVPGLKLKGCFHYDQGYVYFRDVGDRVLIGGARNTAFKHENTSEFGLTEHIRVHLMSFLEQHILRDRSFQIDHAWSGIIALGSEKRPIVTMHSERIAVAVRLGGMGVAIGSLTGAQAAQLILQRL